MLELTPLFAGMLELTPLFENCPLCLDPFVLYEPIYLYIFPTMHKLLAVIFAVFSNAIFAAQPHGGDISSSTYTLKVGQAAVFELKSPGGKLSVVFEDDGQTAYLYALDYSAGDQPIQEAMNIYDAKTFTVKSKSSILRITWSPDGKKAGLWIDNYPHAVFDFSAKRGYCRTAFPLRENGRAMTLLGVTARLNSSNRDDLKVRGSPSTSAISGAAGFVGQIGTAKHATMPVDFSGNC